MMCRKVRINHERQWEVKGKYAPLSGGQGYVFRQKKVKITKRRKVESEQITAARQRPPTSRLLAITSYLFSKITILKLQYPP